MFQEPLSNQDSLEIDARMRWETLQALDRQQQEAQQQAIEAAAHRLYNEKMQAYFKTLQPTEQKEMLLGMQASLEKVMEAGKEKSDADAPAFLLEQYAALIPDTVAALDEGADASALYQVFVSSLYNVYNLGAMDAVANRDARLQAWFDANGAPVQGEQLSSMMRFADSVISRINHGVMQALAKVKEEQTLLEEAAVKAYQKRRVERAAKLEDIFGSRKRAEFIRAENARVVRETEALLDRLSDEKEERQLKERQESAEEAEERAQALFELFELSDKVATRSVQEMDYVMEHQALQLCQASPSAVYDALGDAAKQRVIEATKASLEQAALEILGAQDEKQLEAQRRDLRKAMNIDDGAPLPDWAKPAALPDDPEAREEQLARNRQAHKEQFEQDREHWKAHGDSAAIQAAGGDSAYDAAIAELTGEEKANLAHLQSEIESEAKEIAGVLSDKVLRQKVLNDPARRQAFEAMTEGSKEKEAAIAQAIKEERDQAADKIRQQKEQEALRDQVAPDIHAARQAAIEEARAHRQGALNAMFGRKEESSTPQHDLHRERAPAMKAIAMLRKVRKDRCHKIAEEALAEYLAANPHLNFTAEDKKLFIRMKVKEQYDEQGRAQAQQAEQQALGNMRLADVVRAAVQKQKSQEKPQPPVSTDQVASREHINEGVQLLMEVYKDLYTSVNAALNEVERQGRPKHKDEKDRHLFNGEVTFKKAEDAVIKNLAEQLPEGVDQEALDKVLRIKRTEHLGGKLSNAEYDKAIEQAVREALAHTDLEESKTLYLVKQYALRESLREMRAFMGEYNKAMELAGDIEDNPAATSEELQKVAAIVQAPIDRYLGETNMAFDFYDACVRDSKQLACALGYPDPIGYVREGVHLRTEQEAQREAVEALQVVKLSEARRAQAASLFNETIQSPSCPLVKKPVKAGKPVEPEETLTAIVDSPLAGIHGELRALANKQAGVPMHDTSITLRPSAS